MNLTVSLAVHYIFVSGLTTILVILKFALQILIFYVDCPVVMLVVLLMVLPLVLPVVLRVVLTVVLMMVLPVVLLMACRW